MELATSDWSKVKLESYSNVFGSPGIACVSFDGFFLSESIQKGSKEEKKRSIITDKQYLDQEKEMLHYGLTVIKLINQRLNSANNKQDIQWIQHGKQYHCIQCRAHMSTGFDFSQDHKTANSSSSSYYYPSHPKLQVNGTRIVLGYQTR